MTATVGARRCERWKAVSNIDSLKRTSLSVSRSRDRDHAACRRATRRSSGSEVTLSAKRG